MLQTPRNRITQCLNGKRKSHEPFDGSKKLGSSDPVWDGDRVVVGTFDFCPTNEATRAKALLRGSYGGNVSLYP
jgi:hypothetical protein